MKMTFSKIAYVACGDELSDVRQEIPCWAEGKNNYCTTYEDLISCMDELEDKERTFRENKVFTLLIDAKKQIIEECKQSGNSVGDLIFTFIENRDTAIKKEAY